jgi:hypothetical protein
MDRRMTDREREWLSQADEEGRLPGAPEQTLLTGADVAVAAVNPFVIEACVRAGWVVYEGGHWWITEKGKRAAGPD